LSSSLGIKMRLASRGSLLSFLRAAIAALRRASSGSFGQYRSLHLVRGGSRRRQIELGRNHQRRPLAILDAPVVHVGAADSGHDALDELFLEGLVIFIVVLGPRGAGGHHKANADSYDSQPQRAPQRSRRILHHPAHLR